MTGYDCAKSVHVEGLCRAQVSTASVRGGQTFFCTAPSRCVVPVILPCGLAWHGSLSGEVWRGLPTCLFIVPWHLMPQGHFQTAQYRRGMPCPAHVQWLNCLEQFVDVHHTILALVFARANWCLALKWHEPQAQMRTIAPCSPFCPPLVQHGPRCLPRDARIHLPGRRVAPRCPLLVINPPATPSLWPRLSECVSILPAGHAVSVNLTGKHRWMARGSSSPSRLRPPVQRVARHGRCACIPNRTSRFSKGAGT